MTQMGISVVRKSPCDPGTLCKVTGLQTGTGLGEDCSPDFAVGQRLASCCSAEAMGRHGDRNLMVRRE